MQTTRRNLLIGGTADVNCGDCTACCRSAQFIHVEPDDEAAIAAIPPALLFPAPGLPSGHRVMGFDTDGKCPMLTEAGCSIYESRPRTCRMYDCRVFTVTGLDPRVEGKDAIAEAADRQRFERDDRDEALLEAAHSAVRFLESETEMRSEFPSITSLAVAAIRLYDLFVTGDQSPQRGTGRQPTLDEVQARLADST